MNADRIARELTRCRGALERIARAVDKSNANAEQSRHTLFSVGKIQEIVAADWGLTVSKMLSRTRQEEIRLPRHVAIYFARTLTPCSSASIGVQFGGLDHGTVLKATTAVADRIKRDSEFASYCKTTETKIKENTK